VHKIIDRTALIAPPGHEILLNDYDPGFTAPFETKDDAQPTLAATIERLAALQDVFYADRRRGLLVIFQGMDAAGKDGIIRHVMSGVSPEGVDVHAFTTPTPEELAHDFLWRCATVLPARGRIGIFNRSYYEEVTIVRVHESLLAREHVPAPSTGDDIWLERFEGIVAFERHLVRNGTIVLKFFLHVSKDEQRKRLLSRIDQPEKNWKITPADVHERRFWDAYQHAYERLLTSTSTDLAPWYIIPADRKWFARAAVADVIVQTLAALDLHYPVVTDRQRSQLALERDHLAASDEEKPVTPVDA
jgi:PPK2 family polyphosphate:nucleotide phosphotransferase